MEAGETINGETIITKGLSGGESVVTDGHVRLAPGTQMEISGEAAAPKAEGRPQ